MATTSRCSRRYLDQLADNGIELATDIEFTLDLARAQENARTNISRLKEAGVTTVIYYGDPLTPASLTKEATAQDYHPEWILGSSLLMDTSLFARQTDMQQWKNGFGISLIAARGAQETNGAFRIWDWAYGGLPPNNNANLLNAGMLLTVFPGIHLAGPELTPETFRDGLFRYPPSGGGPTEAQISRGDHGVWPDIDLGRLRRRHHHLVRPRRQRRGRGRQRWRRPVPLRQRRPALHAGQVPRHGRGGRPVRQRCRR